MPHCIVEHSQGLHSDELLEAVFIGARGSELFDSADIKLRAQPFKHFFSGAGRQRFVHVTARILSGRTLEQRQSLSQQILQALETLNLTECSLTVEVIEIERDSYAKTVC